MFEGVGESVTAAVAVPPPLLLLSRPPPPLEGEKVGVTVGLPVDCIHFPHTCMPPGDTVGVTVFPPPPFFCPPPPGVPVGVKAGEAVG